jgi:hypothetical protein
LDHGGNVDVGMFEKLIESAKKAAAGSDKACGKLLKAIG